MRRPFARYPDALARTLELVERCRFSLDELAYQYPGRGRRSSSPRRETLEQLTWGRRGGTVPREPAGGGARHARPRAEADRQARLRAPFPDGQFHRPLRPLAGHPLPGTRLGRQLGGSASCSASPRSILPATTCSSSASSPRGASRAAGHRRRFRARAPRDRRAVGARHLRPGSRRACATVIATAPRGALRDVGKALGLPEDLIRTLSGQVWAGRRTASRGASGRAEPRSLGSAPAARARSRPPADRRPRHLSQHPGGFVLTRDRLDDLVPIEPAAMSRRQVIEWDKDDIDALRFMKVDVLALGMLTCMKRGFDLPAPRTRASRSTSRRSRPRTRAPIAMIASGRHAGRLPDREPGADVDAAAAEAEDLLRPRRSGRDRPARPDPGRHGPSLSSPPEGRGAGALSEAWSWRKCSARRSACRSSRSRRCVAIECAGFTPGEADLLRKSMATFVHRRRSPSKQKLVAGWWRTATSRRSPRRPSDSSKASAAMAFPGEPCRVLRADRLRFGLAEVLASGRVLRGAAELPADGLLRAGADRPRCRRPWRRDPARLRQRLALGLHARTDRR